jgi:hypothetical protein
MKIINDPLQLVVLFVPPQVDNLIISFSNLPKKVGGVILKLKKLSNTPIVWDFNFNFYLIIPLYTHVSCHWCVINTFILILPTFIIAYNTLIMLNIIFVFQYQGFSVQAISSLLSTQSFIILCHTPLR